MMKMSSLPFILALIFLLVVIVPTINVLAEGEETGPQGPWLYETECNDKIASVLADAERSNQELKRVIDDMTQKIEEATGAKVSAEQMVHNAQAQMGQLQAELQAKINDVTTQLHNAVSENETAQKMKNAAAEQVATMQAELETAKNYLNNRFYVNFDLLKQDVSSVIQKGKEAFGLGGADEL